MTGQLSRPVGEFTELHEELRTVARDILTTTAAGTAQDWPAIVAADWPGLEIDDEFDGAGVTFAEVAVVLREMGRALTRSPYASVAVAVAALARAEPSAARDALLRETAAGAAVPVLALSGSTGPADPPFTISRGRAGTTVTGATEFAADVAGATTVLLPARDTDGTTVLVTTRPTGPGISVTAQPCLDTTREFGTLSARTAVVDDEAVWRWGTEGPDALTAAVRRQTVVTAIDSLGLAEGALAATVEHVRTREQFGRPVGSFQAVKHACADMLVSLRIGTQLVGAATTAEVRDDPDAWIAAARAKSYTCAAAVDIAGKAVQLHGGMGYTWESGIHRYLERATLNRSLYGSPSEHRARLAARYRDPHFTP
ncbi:acyl-CoA dehydrogenase family protein [Nocardia sp. NPDC052254]|uniref:acyl-CoA dehydrogenase family protein n=1 Tax=Nocardia sp. NPDC052254 TaxID=3155681 RepID=UPI00344103BA